MEQTQGFTPVKELTPDELALLAQKDQAAFQIFATTDEETDVTEAAPTVH